MRLFIVLIAAIVLYINTQGQSPEQYLYREPVATGSKTPIDFNGIEQWKAVLSAVDFRSATLSRDGRYCSYATKEGVVVQSTENDWRHIVLGIKPGFFAGNNRQYIFQSKDSLCFLSLGSDAKTVISGVIAYQLPQNDDCNEWIAIMLKDGSCILKNLLNGKERHFNNAGIPSFTHKDWFGYLNKNGNLSVMQLATGKTTWHDHVSSYDFDENGRVLILLAHDGERRNLQWVNPTSGQSKEIWSTSDKHIGIGGHLVDASGSRIVFLVEAKQSGKLTPTIWYYQKGMEQAAEMVNHRTVVSLNADLELVPQLPRFSANGKYIVFDLKETENDNQKTSPNAVQLDVWHYKDKFMMSAQLEDINISSKKKNRKSRIWKEKIYSAAIATEGAKETLLLSTPEEPLLTLRGDYALTIKNENTSRLWEKLPPSYFVVSLKNGGRRQLKRSITHIFYPPNDNSWILCFDGRERQYLCYNFSTDSYQNLSAAIPYNLAGGVFEFFKFIQSKVPESQNFWWLEGRKSVLVNDYYDIWELDVTGKKSPVNITGEYGRKNNIRFDIIPCQGEREPYSPNIKVRPDIRLLLSAVNMTTKETGFYAIRPDRPGDPEPLSIGAHVQYLPDRLAYGDVSRGLLPLKAHDADVWLVQRMTNSEPPNLYVTRDLKTMKKLTNVSPPQRYNWLTTELVSFTQQDGSITKGLLYKPENFDENKKYPVLIYYYKQETLRLHDYLEPDYTKSAHINIPWFVSRGYLVFIPDIYFNKALKGAAALNAVEGAATWLARRPFVDSTKMAISGHSVGGALTIYILTHSTRFAAVFEGAGASDLVTNQLQLTDLGTPRMQSQVSEDSIQGSDIWTHRDRYLENPILHVDKIMSPLLMFHNKVDGAVPFLQALELFVSMWRMGKKAWLLQYDQGNHGVILKKDAQDLTIRVTQFFDHYLKGAPAPVWMTRGIDARLKGIETGLELDKADVQP
ncbi:S9 family peptidase [Pseudoflavitalea sp. X16]|uniref:alpha/beta hydrolase family protein n=1 Tax=Paraflavitalea devenefica TaxID=2716334 RepID=UPI00141DC206|nr:prolyl oligopeptidase family serine peptidase [Paraflavitalea devenefica]NII27758.1 S9 family peptidase [Paraflavitalea devenefica]